MSDNAQQSATPIIDIEKESQVYKQIPGGIRLTSLGAGIGASIAFGIGTGSFAIGIGSLLALFYLGSEFSLQMTKHRGCQKSE